METVEALMRVYRTTAEKMPPGCSLELEVRFGQLEFGVFRQLHRLLEGWGAADGQTGTVASAPLEYSVNAIQTVREGQSQTQRIRRVTFLPDGTKQDEYASKKPEGRPVRVTQAGLPHRVALSRECPAGEFVLDSSATLRVKKRASYQLTPVWRADLTLVRELPGQQASLLATVKSQLFGSSRASADLLAGVEESRALRYEFELEFTGEPAQAEPAALRSIVEQIQQGVNPHYLEAARYLQGVQHVAALLLKDRRLRQVGLKQLLPAALALTRSDYMKIYPPVGYYVTDKADGVRTVAVTRGQELQVLGKDLKARTLPAGVPPPQTTLVDCEQVGETLYVFDVMVCDGQTLHDRPLEERLARLEDACTAVRLYGQKAEPKQYRVLANRDPASLRAVFEATRDQKRPYRTDGLILVRPGQNYMNTVTYKWKPSSENTIDFLVRRDEAADRYLLFVGIGEQTFRQLGLRHCRGYRDLFPATEASYFPTLFQPATAPEAYVYTPKELPQGFPDSLDGLVVEFRCAGGCLGAAGRGAAVEWEPVRVREDRAREQRYYGNDFRTAEAVWSNYMDPFSFEHLYDGPAGQAYFRQDKAGAYVKPTYFVSHVKEGLIARLQDSQWVVDLGSGKGQDLGRYLRSGIRNLVAVDPDRTAVTELVRRRHDLARKGSGSMALHVVIGSFTEPHAVLARDIRAVRGFPSQGCDGVVCNLAVHYAAATAEQLRNFAALCGELVREGGTVTLTYMDGGRVLQLLAENRVGLNESWQVYQDDVRKYAILREFRGARLTAAGQQIRVLLPFSEEMYPEYLVNPASLDAAFARHGMPLEDRGSFADKLEEFGVREAGVARRLTADDRTWVSLYSYSVYRRKK